MQNSGINNIIRNSMIYNHLHVMSFACFIFYVSLYTFQYSNIQHSLIPHSLIHSFKPKIPKQLSLELVIIDVNIIF